MKKRLFSILLSICMVLTMIPMAGGGVFAQTTKTTEHKHCVCGAEHQTIGDHKNIDEKTFTEWTDTLAEEQNGAGNTASNSLPATAGNYYLTKDVVISETWKPADGTVLCLNGKTITGEVKDKYVIYITNGSFDLTDCCRNTGSIAYGGGGVFVDKGKTFNMYAGIIRNSINRGLVIYGTANMYDGVIKENGGGVILNYSDYSTNFNMYGGSIIKNKTASSDGAGVNRLAGRFTVSGNVQITGNSKGNDITNVFSHNRGTIRIGADGLDENTQIGLTQPSNVGAIDIVAANDTDYSDRFTADNAGVEIRYYQTDRTLYFSTLLTQTGFNFASETLTAQYGDSVENQLNGVVDGDNVTYSSNNSTVASVDRTTGAVTIVGEGKTVIKAIKKNTDPKSPNYRAYYNLTVTKRTAVAGDFDFTRPADLTYDGNPKTAQVALDSKYTGCGDITVKYYDESGNQIEAVNAGTYKVKIDIAEGENFASVKDLYVGTFTVDAKQLEEGMIADIDAQTYTGNTITPEVTVTDGSRTLVEGADYDVTYEIKPDSTGTLSENKPIGAGTYNVIITGKGNYSGAVTKPFAISAKQEADVIAPEIRVLAGESREVDLSSYKKNATDVMRGAHSYDNVFDRSIPPYKVSGEDKVGFTIKSDAAVGDSGTITVGVESADGNTYYDIQFKVTVRSKYSKPSKPPVQKPSIAAGKGFKAELSSDGTKATITVEEGYEIVDVLVNGISKGKVTEITGLKTGDTIEVKTEKKQPEPVKPADNKRIIKGVKNTEIELETTVNKDGNIVIKWKKSKGYRVDSFEILRAVKKNGKYSKIYTTKSGKASRIVNAKNLKDGKRYYYKVRGVRTIDGKKYYTEWSNIESEKVNK